jgi:hypothetical protein
MLDYFDHRATGYDDGRSDRGFRVLPDTTLTDHQDPAFEPSAYYWVAEQDLNKRFSERYRYFVGFSKVTGVGNERSFRAFLIPRGGVGDSVTAILHSCDPRLLAAFYCSMVSLSFDYICRLKVGRVNINVFHFKQFSTPPPSSFTESDIAMIMPRVLELQHFPVNLNRKGFTAIHR